MAQARLCLLRPPGVQATVVSEAQCSACGVGEVPTAIRDHLLRVVTVPGLQEEARGLSLYEAQFPLTAGPSAALGSLAGGLSGLCWSLCHSPRVACLDLQVLLSLLWDMPLASAPSGASPDLVQETQGFLESFGCTLGSGCQPGVWALGSGTYSSGGSGAQPPPGLFCGPQRHRGAWCCGHGSSGPFPGQSQSCPSEETCLPQTGGALSSPCAGSCSPAHPPAGASWPPRRRADL